MKLDDLLEQCLGTEEIQISWNDREWEEYDTFNVDSPVLMMFKNNTIHSLTAVENDTFRVTMNLFEIGEDGTFLINVKEAKDIKRVVVTGEDHCGDIYYPDERKEE